MTWMTTCLQQHRSEWRATDESTIVPFPTTSNQAPGMLRYQVSRLAQDDDIAEDVKTRPRGMGGRKAKRRVDAMA